MGNNQSNNHHANNDYRPDPTRSDRIRGDGGGKGGDNNGAKKNGYRSQLSAGQSPSHGVVGVPVLPVPPSSGREKYFFSFIIIWDLFSI